MNANFSVPYPGIIRLILSVTLALGLIACQGSEKISETKGQQETTAYRDTVVSLPGGAIMEMIWIEPGTFTMGTTEVQASRSKSWQASWQLWRNKLRICWQLQQSEGWSVSWHALQDKGLWEIWMEQEQPAHEVTISRGFYLGKYELTQGQWVSVMSSRPWVNDPAVQEQPNHPAADISWNDIQLFIQRLNETEEQEVYRLPTEAEWEYACRAGTTTWWSFGNDLGRLKDYAWYGDNARDIGEIYGHAVGTKLPNPWGLFDMHGNVGEWVQDWYSPSYYANSPNIDPPGPVSGTGSTRGWSFVADGMAVRSASRGGSITPDSRIFEIGARLLRQQVETPSARSKIEER
jgi:formylglycine-generating enzyme required for sulfatase activity